MTAVQNVVDTRQQDAGNISNKAGGKSYGNYLVPFQKVDKQDGKEGYYGSA